MDWKIASEVATVIASVGVIGVFVQISLTLRQLKADHERSRREKTVDLCQTWSSQLQKHGSISRKIVESLDEEQSRNLYKENTVNFSSEFKEILKELFGHDCQLEDLPENRVKIDSVQSSKLRWQIITYLNSLESILIAWHYNIVDREIIERQFSYLMSPMDGHYLLKNFRIACGGAEAYPAIELFAKQVAGKEIDPLPPKTKIA